jgi:hypothetical protein
VTNALIHRTEQAVLGAVLQDVRHLDRISYLTPKAFADPTHRSVYTELLNVRQQGPAARPRQPLDAVLDRLGPSGVAKDYLEGLVGACPEPTHVAYYARIVQEAAARRTLSSVGAGLPPPDQRLGRALRELAWPDDGPTPGIAPDPRTAPAPRSAGLDMTASQEDLVLADLLQHPELMRDVTSWLTVEVFTSETRREIYTALVTVSRPVPSCCRESSPNPSRPGPRSSPAPRRSRRPASRDPASQPTSRKSARDRRPPGHRSPRRTARPRTRELPTSPVRRQR